MLQTGVEDETKSPLSAPEVFLSLDLTVCGLDIMAGRDIIVKRLGISVSQHLDSDSQAYSQLMAGDQFKLIIIV